MPVGSVCQRVTSGGTPSRATPEYFRGNIPWVKTQELLDCWIDDTEEHITEEAIQDSSAKLLPRDTVLLALYGATVGQLGILRDSMTCNQACCAMIVDPQKADARYLYYQLLLHRSQLKSLASGAAQQNLSGQLIRSLELPFPPIKEQRRIAHILGTLDDKIELNRRMNETLESIARAIFKSWFSRHRVGALTGRVEDLIDAGVLAVNDGYRAKRIELSADGLPFARAGNLLNTGFDFDNAELLGSEGIEAAGEKVSRPFDAVFTSKGTVGRIAQVSTHTPRFVYAPQLCFWRVSDRSALDPHVLYQWMHGEEFRDQLDTLKGQTDMADYVSLRDQRKMRITLPGMERQREIAPVLTGLRERIANNVAESRTLTSIRDTLLPKLLSGELVRTQCFAIDEQRASPVSANSASR